MTTLPCFISASTSSEWLNQSIEKMEEDAFYAMVRDQLNKLPGIKKSSLYIYDQVMGFYYAVSWSKEPWLQAILATHVLLFLLVIFARRNQVIQALIFLGSCAVIFFAESLNEMAGKRWREFSTQNYFDKHGVFTSVVLSTPLLLILFVQLLLTLRDASHMIVKLKRHELKLQRIEKDKDNDKKEN